MGTIITKNSATSGSVPSSLIQGELAINVANGRLFYGSGSGNAVKEFGVTSSYALNALSASFAQTASFAPAYLPLTGGTINGDLVVNGTASIAFLNVTYESASVIYSSGSNQFGDASNDTQTLWGTVDMKSGPVKITGSLITTGSNTLIGNTSLTGSLLVSGSTTQIGNNTLFGNTLVTGSLTISGSNPPGSITASVQIYGDIRQSGYHRFDPVSTNIDTSISASYIYVSGSTNDLYFSQNSAGYNNVTRLRWIEGNLYTGLLHGGIITTQSSTVYQVASGSGIIVNLNASIPNDPYPTVQYLAWPNLSASIAPLSASFDQSFIAINSSGSINVQGTPYEDGQYNTVIPIGVVVHQNRSTINAIQTFPGVAYGWKQRSFDFIKAFGPLKISGYTLSPSGSSTGSLVLSGGTAWVDGRNYTIDPNNPSYIVESTGITTSKIYRYYQSGSDFVYNTNGGAGYATIDPANYALSGSLTPVGTNDWTIQRVFYFPNSGTKAFYIYYGNATYSSKDHAIAGILTEPFNEAPNTAANAIFVGYMILRHNADFTVAASYEFRSAGLFRSAGQGGAGGGGATPPGGSNTQIQYNNNNTFGGVPNLVWNGTTLSGTGSFSGSFIGTFTGSLQGTASFANNATTASYVLNAVSASFASTASFVNPLNQNVIITGSLTSTANVQANKFIFANSVVNQNNLGQNVYATDSNILYLYTGTSGLYINNQANSAINVLITDAGAVTTRGSITAGAPGNDQSIYFGGTNAGLYWASSGASIFYSVGALQFSSVGSPNNMILQNGGGALFNYGITGSLQGTSSWANNAVTASYVLNAVSASFSISSSRAVSASFALTASFVQTAQTASYVLNAVSASFASTASFVPTLKASSASVASFGGRPYSASVTFGTAYPNNLYSVTVTGEDSRAWSISGKTSTGFTIDTNSSTLLTGPVYWIATPFNL